MTESDQYEKNFEWSRFWKENLERKWDKDAYVKWLVELQKEYNEDAEKDDGGDAEKANQEPKEQKKYYHLPEVGDIKKLVGDRGEKPGKKISKEAKSYTQERSSQKSDVSLILEWLQQKNILEEHSDSNEETALNEQLLQKPTRKGFVNNISVGTVVGSIILLELLVVVGGWKYKGNFTPLSKSTFDSSISNTHALGNILYTDYIHLFQISGIILLVAMIGAITLTFSRRENVKRQSYFAQINRDKDSAVSLVDVENRKGVNLNE